jgi:hypothetical protein
VFSNWVGIMKTNEQSEAQSFFCRGHVMNDQPKLSDAEWAVVRELLERELHDLPGEIHHTRVASYREELKRRAEIVKNLLERLRTPRT